MPRIPAHTLEDAPAASRPMLEALARHSRSIGRLLRLHAEMAHAPALLAAYVGMRRALEEHGTLDPRTRVGVMLAVSSLHGGYTEALNIMLARATGWSEPAIEALRDGHALDEPRVDALVVLARAAAHDGRVEDATWRAALAGGWSTTEILEAYTSAGLALFIGGYTRLAETPIDVPAEARTSPTDTHRS